MHSSSFVCTSREVLPAPGNVLAGRGSYPEGAIGGAIFLPRFPEARMSCGRRMGAKIFRHGYKFQYQNPHAKKSKREGRRNEMPGKLF